ncbi:MAG: FtsX-like permease family protein [Clostridium sp.]|nr:FtsX-like permease family protein [Clostridium sp.]MCM1398544.1 FtsX-like permease family protein [Clostridium sp.]MCM1459832.1 FtsX-like permease family protein [Bacteroides sp.]
MYIFKNSCKNLWRNKGRNFIVFLIAMITLTSVTLASAIHTLSNQAITQYRDSFHVDASLDFNWEKLEQDFPPKEIKNEDGSTTWESAYELPETKLEDYINYSNSGYVKGMQYLVWVQFASEGLAAVPDNLHENESMITLDGMGMEELKNFFHVETEAEVAEQLGGEQALQQVLNMKNNCVGMLFGYTNLSLVEEFSNGENQLKNGRFPEQDNECIVSSKYAEYNGLEIGDTIAISGPDKTDTDNIVLTITGIYTASRSEASAETLGDAYGYVYTTFHTVADSGFHWIGVDKAVFELKNPECAELFEQELHKKGLSEYKFLSCTNSAEEYRKNTEPLENISNIAKIFTLCICVVGAAVIFLLSFINVRERKYEIGVLRAIGMKKSGIARGMAYETLMLMLIGFGSSMLASMLFIEPIASALVGMSKVNMSLSVHDISLCTLMAVVLSIGSGLCAIFFVMRHEPMKILVERN